MKTYEQVDNYMQEVGLKYVKSTNDFLTGLAIRTDKEYTTDIANELNARATGQFTNNSVFYNLKNKNFDGSIFVSAAFDGGVFRHIGNMIMDEAELFNGQIIDLACDCGIVTCFIAKMYPNSKIIGVDINELAINNAQKLADKLGVTNVEFICADALEYTAENKADTICSFRGLLDVCMNDTNGLPFFGNRDWREEQYKNAFSTFASAISNNLKDDGVFISVERYTADYGLLGWMMALAENGINTLADKCSEMRASDLSSVKDYSVTFATKSSPATTPLETLNTVLGKSFKTGTGYDSYMAEFALYYDSEGGIKLYDIFNENDKLLHEFAVATAKSGKIMSYEASGNKKRIKYFNSKKADAVQKDIDDKLAVYSSDKFTIKEIDL